MATITVSPGDNVASKFSSASNGDTIELRASTPGGTSTITAATGVNVSASADNLTITERAGDTVTLVIPGSGGEVRLNINGDNITLQAQTECTKSGAGGLRISGSRLRMVVGGDNFTMRGIDFTNGGTNIGVSVGYSSTVQGFNVYNCRVHDVGRNSPSDAPAHCFYLENVVNARIEHSYMWNADDRIIQMFPRCDDGVFQYNVLYAGNQGMHIGNGKEAPGVCDQPDNNLFERNICMNNKAHSEYWNYDGCGDAKNGNHALSKDNVVYRNDGGSDRDLDNPTGWSYSIDGAAYVRTTSPQANVHFHSFDPQFTDPANGDFTLTGSNSNGFGPEGLGTGTGTDPDPPDPPDEPANYGGGHYEVGTLYGGCSAAFMRGSEFTYSGAANKVPTSVFWYSRNLDASLTQNVTCKIYNINGLLLAESAEITYAANTAANWTEFTFDTNNTFAVGEGYRISFHTDANPVIEYAYTAATALAMQFAAAPYTSGSGLPNPHPAWTPTDKLLSAYVTIGDPSPSPVTGLTVTPGDTENALSWTNPGTVGAIVVRRSTGSYPATSASGTGVYSGTGTSVTDTSLTNGVAYFYSVFNVVSTVDSEVVQGTGTPEATPLDPVSPVTSLAVAPGDENVVLSWTLPSPAAVITVRSSTSGFPATPTDGDATDATAATGGLTGLTVSSLTNATLYYFSVFVIDGERYSAPATATSAPVAPTADPVSAFTATSTGVNSVNLAWSNPDEFDTITVRYATSGYPSSILDGALAYTGTGDEIAVTGLTPNTQYYFRAYATNGSSTSDAASATATTDEPASPGSADPLAAFAASVPTNGTSVTFTWTPPTNSDFVSLRYKLNGGISDPTDGEVLYSATGATEYTVDLPETGATYFVYAYNHYNTYVSDPLYVRVVTFDEYTQLYYRSVGIPDGESARKR